MTFWIDDYRDEDFKPEKKLSGFPGILEGIKERLKGGPGSGFYSGAGHAGIPGKRGGSRNAKGQSMSMKRLQGVLDDARRNIGDSRKKLVAARKEYRQLQDTIHNKSTEKTNLIEWLQGRMKDRNDLLSYIEIQNDTINVLNEDMKSQSALGEDISGILQEIKKANEAKKYLEDRLAESDKKADESNEKIKALESEIEQLKDLRSSTLGVSIIENEYVSHIDLSDALEIGKMEGNEVRESILSQGTSIESNIEKIDKDINDINMRMSQLAIQGKMEEANALTDEVLKKVDEEMGERRKLAAIKEKLYQSTSASITAEYPQWNETAIGAYNDVLNDVNKLAGDNPLLDKVSVNSLKSGRRAYEEYKGIYLFYSGDKDNPFSLRSSNETFAHELGHFIEESDPLIFSACRNFLDDRTFGESEEKLKNIYPDLSYDGDEVTKKDKFKNAYTGKIYRSQNSGNIYATEVLSMGIQYFYSDPIKFAKDDPEYFNFVYAVLRLGGK